MKIKTSELIGNALDWAVLQLDAENPSCGFYSTDWADGGPIIERERIQLRDHNNLRGHWTASVRVVTDGWVQSTVFEDGLTPLVAAMRCYVASKLGDEVEVPEDVK